jgi:hypothetical protein
MNRSTDAGSAGLPLAAIGLLGAWSFVAVHCASDLLLDEAGGGTLGVVDEVSVALGGRCATVAQQAADQGEGKP